MLKKKTYICEKDNAYRIPPHAQLLYTAVPIGINYLKRYYYDYPPYYIQAF